MNLTEKAFFSGSLNASAKGIECPVFNPAEISGRQLVTEVVRGPFNARAVEIRGCGTHRQRKIEIAGRRPGRKGGGYCRGLGGGEARRIGTAWSLCKAGGNRGAVCRRRDQSFATTGTDTAPQGPTLGGWKGAGGRQQQKAY